MIGNFYRAYTGLEVNNRGLEVIGNNLSNMNTVGFKRSQTNFEQLMSSFARGASGAGAPIQFGLGAQVSEVVPIFSQGAFLSTGLETHLALGGPGFFAVNNGGTTAYTRAGNFSFDENGALVATNGAIVQGYTQLAADGTIDTTGAVGDISIAQSRTSPAVATTTARFVTNLSAAATSGETFVSSMEIYDSNGVARPLNLIFTKTDTAGEWTYRIELEGNDLPATVELANGSIQFGTDGTLAAVDGTPVSEYENQQITISGLPNGAADQTFTWDLVDRSVQGFGFLTNLGETSNTGSSFQNGSGSGDLQRISFDRDGVMRGFYTNGDVLPLARLALASFPNNTGLRQLNAGFFSQTGASGEPQLGAAGQTTILAGTLETSNVDVADEFTALIVHQRGFQSNAKTVTTTDQMLQEVVNLKR